MKRICVSIFSMLLVFCASDAKPLDSILTAASFPKNADDLTFRQRMDVLADGYDVFDTVFDSNGVCIQNCPYVGITIDEYEKRIEHAAQEVQNDLDEIQSYSNTSSVPNNLGIQEANNTPDYNNDPNPISDSQPVNEQPVNPEYPEQSENPQINPPQPGNFEQQEYAPLATQAARNSIPQTCPVRGNTVRVSDEWGCRLHPIKKIWKDHTGLDLSVLQNTPVYAAGEGKVILNRYDSGGYGNYVKIQHANGYSTLYGHLNKSLVKVGEHVAAGQKIALSGNTGGSTGAHLHFEILKNGTTTNPRTIIKCPLNPSNNSNNLKRTMCQSKNKRR